MSDLNYTLLTDGSSDKALIPILNWLLYQLVPNYAIQGNYADLRLLHRPPKALSDRIVKTIDLFPCQIIFIHRDAENKSREDRYAEINAAMEKAQQAKNIISLHVPVIPVRMTEAWLLIDESSIRRVAGNPHGRISLDMPMINSLETLPDPKETLYDLLRRASDCSGRRLKSFNRKIGSCVHRLADSILDFTPLYNLSAFKQFEEEIRTKLHSLGY